MNGHWTEQAGGFLFVCLLITRYQIACVSLGSSIESFILSVTCNRPMLNSPMLSNVMVTEMQQRLVDNKKPSRMQFLSELATS